MPQRQKPAVCAAFDGMIRARPLLPRRSLSWTVLASALILVVSCGGEVRLAPPANPSATPKSATHAAPLVAATPARQPTIGGVIWTTEVDPTTGEPGDSVALYAPDAPRLVAATKAAALPAGSRVEASWTYNGTPLEPFTTRLSADSITDGQWLSFYLTRDPNTPWPAGQYEIAVTLDGTQMQESAVEVVIAE
jgi:hypothetical protein